MRVLCAASGQTKRGASLRETGQSNRIFFTFFCVSSTHWGTTFLSRSQGFTADTDGIMPPKSNWFEPKLRDAMFCHMT